MVVAAFFETDVAENFRPAYIFEWERLRGPGLTPGAAGIRVWPHYAKICHRESAFVRISLNIYG